MRALLLDITDVTRNLRPKRHLEFIVGAGFQVDAISGASESEKQSNPRFLSLRESVSFPNKQKNHLLRLVNVLGLFGGLRDGAYYRRILEGPLNQIRENQYEFALVENLYLLHFALGLKNVKRVVFDIREYHPAEFEESLVWRILVRPQMRNFYIKDVGRADVLLAVSPGIADRIGKEFGRKVSVILNVPNHKPLVRTDKPGSPLKLVYHGIVNRQRSIDHVVDLISGLANVTLDLYPIGKRTIVEKLRKRSVRTLNVAVREPVDPHNIVKMLGSYDLGLVFYTEDNFNLRIALPNKFFEYIYAGVPPVVAPGGAMADFVRRTGFGFVAENGTFRSLAALLATITSEQIEDQRKRLPGIYDELDISVQRQRFLDAIGGPG